MRPYTVEFVEHRSVTTSIPLFGAYKFTPKGKLSGLQRMAWAFLEWCGAIEQSYEPKVTVTRHTIDADKFVDRVLRQRRALLEGFHKSGQRLLIGSEDYAELMTSPEMMPYHFSFDAEVHSGRNVLGLNVEVIPWMRGAVVMP